MRKKWFKWFMLLLIQIIFWKLIVKIDGFPEFWFNNFVVHYQSIVNFFTSFLRRGIGELFYLCLILCSIFYVVNSIKSKLFHKPIQLVFFFVFFYNLVWGTIYSKSNFIVEKNIEFEQDKLKELYKYSLNEAILARSEISKDQANPIRFKSNVVDYLNEYKLYQKQLMDENWIVNKHQIESPKAIYSNVSSLMNYLGILGYYNPFSVEANINRHNSDLKSPLTVFHELAHQNGYASESEANFIAYFIGSKSKNNDVKYAANFKLLFHLLNILKHLDPEFAKEEYASLPKGILLDRESDLIYYEQFEGKLNDLFSEINNKFLKLNNQEGIVSYSRYSKLVYYYHYKK